MERPSDFAAPVQALAKRLLLEPDSWVEARGGVREMFDRLAPEWDQIATREGHLGALAAALERVSSASVALDIGTGSGRGADMVASRYPDAAVIGADLSEPMLREAAARDRPRRVGFVCGDASQLPFTSNAFDLVVALNMFPFFAEMGRVLRPGGHLVIVYSGAEKTPVWVPTELVREHLSERFELEDGRAGDGLWILARRRA